MAWRDSTQHPKAGEWSFKSQLTHTDPYLMWYALTDFSGVRLPLAKGTNDALVPTLLELPDKPRKPTSESAEDGLRAVDPVGLRYSAKALKLPELQTLVAAKLGKTVMRFEVSPGVIGDTVQRDLELQNKSQLSMGRTRRSRSTKDRPLVGFIDYGCAFAHRQFQDPRGLTRVLALWDQAGVALGGTSAGPRLQWRLPPGFHYGRETHRDRSWEKVRGPAGRKTLAAFIEAFRRPAGEIDEVACYRASGYEPIIHRRATHGTHVMDLATGAPAPHLKWLDSVLPGPERTHHDADIAFVQLPRWIGGRSVGGLLRANVFDAVGYLLTCASPGQPVVINLSYGGNAGPHDGTSVFEQALDWRLAQGARELGATVHLVVPSGNARLGRMHAVAMVPGESKATFLWENPPDDPSDSFIEFWTDDADKLSFKVESPDGEELGATAAGSARHLEYQGSPVAMLVVPHRVCQSTRGRMALLAVTRTRRTAGRPTAPYGRWVITVLNSGSSAVRVDAWCERDDPAIGTVGLPRQSRFVDGHGQPDVARVEQDGTLNSIAHGRQVDVVGARYAQMRTVLPYSGTGPGRGAPGRSRHLPTAVGSAKRGPDLLMPGSWHPTMPGLPGAGVLSGDVVRMEGTSQACALATRSAIEQILSGSPAAPPPPSRKGNTRPSTGKQRPNPPRPPQPRPPPQGHPDEDLLPAGPP